VCHPLDWNACRPQTTPDTEALVQAFDDVRDRLLRRLHALLGNAADAQDALQTAFLHCWRARGEVNRFRNLRGWVWRVGVNAGRDLQKYLRCRRAEPLYAAAAAVDRRRTSPAAALLEREDRDRLHEALDRLRPAERAVFRMRQEDALSYQEIARRHGCPVGTAKGLMHKAVHKLRPLLREP
jgi:RNA polymerase sigma-70 factor (ECF subfamily)